MDEREGRLDGVRAVAIAGVVTVHTSQTISLGAPVWLLETAGLGRFGVQLFFLLSGFLLGTLYSSRDSWSARRYARRRFARIYPLYFIFACLWLLLAWTGVSSPVSATALTALLTLVLANDLWWVSAWGFLPGAWSISAEAVHYGIFPVVRRWSARRLMMLAAVLVLVSTLVGAYAYVVTRGDYSGQSGEFWTWINTLAPWNTVAFFVVGIALAVAPRWQEKLTGRVRLVAGGAIVLAAGFTVVVGSLTAVILVAAVCTFALLATSRRQPASLLQWIGRRSYGTYFTHFVVLLAIGKVLAGRTWELPLATTIVVLATAIVVVLAISTAISQVLWVTVERRAIEWSRRARTATP